MNVAAWQRLEVIMPGLRGLVEATRERPVLDLVHTEPSARVLHGDALDAMGVFDPGTFDVVVLDPPYNVGCNYEGTNDRKTPQHYGGWITAVLLEAARIARAVLYFPGTANIWHATGWLHAAGLRPVHMLGWMRKEFAGDRFVTGHPAACWEPVILAAPSEANPSCAPVYGHAGRDFLVIPSHRNLHLGHPCPKPVRVMTWLLGLFLPPNGIVLDPVCGAGTTLLATKELGAGRLAVGVDHWRPYCEITARRLAQGVLPTDADGA